MMFFVSRSTFPFITTFSLIICCAMMMPHLQTANAAGFVPKKIVRIYDQIPNNNNIQAPTPLYVHCKSKTDDLGTWTMTENMERDISFRVNWVGTTLFWCHFVWGSKSQEFTVFDAEHDDFNLEVYNNWIVKEDGFYRSGGTSFDRNKLAYFWIDKP